MESTMSGGNMATSGDEPRLEQPGDAVPMENMAQPSATQRDATQVARDAGSSGADPEQGATDAPASPKGKGKAQEAPAPPSKERSNSSMAIGPAQNDGRPGAPGGSDGGGPVCNITLLLTSGNRHPYKIDAKYLARRNVTVPDETESGHPDPFNISVYTLKELILREWRSDWEAKPANPSSIRLIHFGKLLDDKEQLKKYHFSTEHPNMVHMSIRPSDLDEEEPKSGSKSLPAAGRDGQRSRSGGRCCVVL